MKPTIPITFVRPKILVVKSGNIQVEITTAEGDTIFVDLTTIAKAIIENLTKGMQIISALGLFNPNGLSPLASQESVIVPR